MLKKQLLLALMALPFLAFAQGRPIAFGECHDSTLVNASSSITYQTPFLYKGDLLLLRTKGKGVRYKFELLSPTGIIVAAQSSVSTADLLQTIYTVPPTGPEGNYRVIISATGSSGGNFSIAIEKMNSPATAVFLECNASLSGSLTCGPVIKTYRYLVKQGARSRIKVVPSGTAPEAWLCDKSGQILAHEAADLGDVITFDTVLAAQTDCYYVFVASSDAFFFTNYSVSHTLLFGECAAPVVQTIPPSGNVCTGDAFSLTASSPFPNATYLWNGPNGFTSSQPQISFSGAADSMSGNYTVTVSVPGICPGVVTRTISVKPLPAALASATPASVCAGSTFKLDVSTNATTYQWSGPNGYSSTSKSPQIAVPVNAQTELRVYVVTVTDGTTGCTNTSSVAVQINAKPTVIIDAPPNGKVCQGQTLQLNVATDAQAPVYSWSGPIFCGFSSTLKNPQIPDIDFDCQGNYFVTVTDLNTGCSNTSIRYVAVNSLPLADITGGSLPLCAGEEEELTGCCANIFHWSTGETTKDITVTPLTTTKYFLTVTDNNGCTDVDSTVINVKPLPTISIASMPANPEICSGEGQIVLCASSNAKEPGWKWTGPGFNSTLQCISLSTPQQSGIYTAVVTDGITDCSNIIKDTIIIHATPTVSISQLPAPAPYCEGESFTLCVSSDGTLPTYTWTGPDNLSSSGICVSIAGASSKHAGNYNVTVTDIYNCRNSASIPVDIDPVPTAAISGDLSICEGSATTLTAAGGVNYKWSTGASGATIVVSPAATTFYTVTVTNNFGCASTASATVAVSPNNLSLSVFADGNTVLASASGGTPPYTYSISWPGQQPNTNGIFSNVPGGTYTVSVTDAFGCSTMKTVIVTGIVEPSDAWGLSVSPNPGSGLFEIALANSPLQTLRFDLFDTNGRFLRAFVMETANIALDLTGLSNGFYLLRVTDGEKMGVVRLVVMR